MARGGISTARQPNGCVEPIAVALQVVISYNHGRAGEDVAGPEITVLPNAPSMARHQDRRDAGRPVDTGPATAILPADNAALGGDVLHCDT